MNQTLANNQNLKKLTQDLFSFLSKNTLTPGEEADALFVFGGIGLEIPEHAADLYHKGHANKILVTGKSGAFTQKHFVEKEAQKFQEILEEKDVPLRDIILEKEATNAGENVALGMKKLCDSGVYPKTLILVCRSFMALRAEATFKKQFPEITCYLSPPAISLKQTNLSLERLATRLVGELDRLRNYPQQGFISQTTIPSPILKKEKELRQILEI
ncbi:MAG: YdcF family protein [Bacteroidota bacterium]